MRQHDPNPPAEMSPEAVSADAVPGPDELWARSGAMALTGYSAGPALLPRGTPAAAVHRGLIALAARFPDVQFPGVELLGERAAIAGLTRRAPVSPGGAFRILPSASGWLGLSLARDSDRELVPALIGRAVDLTDTEACWQAIGTWLAECPAPAAEARSILLGLPVARIPPAGQRRRRRAPVRATTGGPRSQRGQLVVLDLSALWAGPLCAHLLGLAGARVIKVESAARLDGTRRGPAEFYDVLHQGHESVVLDFADPGDLALLRSLTWQAGVVIEASRPRALRQLGVSAEEAVARGAIWVSITAYGRDGANGIRVGFGDDVAAGAGLVADTPDGPVPAGDALADPLTGVAAAAAVAGRLATPLGALLDISMHDVCRDASQQPARAVNTACRPAPPTARRPARRAATAGLHTSAVRAEFGRS